MMNRVVLVGRLTRDPELRYTPNGTAVANFTIAANRPFKNQQGENEADFLNCVVWRKPAENLATYMKKGNLIGVDGRLQSRTYEDKDGKTVYVVEVVADNVQFLEPRGTQSSRGSAPQEPYSNQNQPAQSNYNQNQTQSQSQNPFDNTGQIDISDDDLPF